MLRSGRNKRRLFQWLSGPFVSAVPVTESTKKVVKMSPMERALPSVHNEADELIAKAKKIQEK
jgi:hypothetical protein